MKCMITARKTDVSTSMREVISKKVENLDRFHHRILQAEAVIEKEGDIVHFKLHVKAGHKSFHVDAKAENVGKALDAGISRMERKLRNIPKKTERRESIRRPEALVQVAGDDLEAA